MCPQTASASSVWAAPAMLRSDTVVRGEGSDHRPPRPAVLMARTREHDCLWATNPTWFADEAGRETNRPQIVPPTTTPFGTQVTPPSLTTNPRALSSAWSTPTRPPGSTRTPLSTIARRIAAPGPTATPSNRMLSSTTAPGSTRQSNPTTDPLTHPPHTVPLAKMLCRGPPADRPGGSGT